MKCKMTAMATFLVSVGLISTGSPAFEQVETPGVSTTYMSCMARAGANTVQSGICAQTEMASQDARLNKAYQQVMRQLASEPAKHTALREEQRSWLKTRDYECKVDQQTISSTCIVAKTAIRATELENQIQF